MLSQNDYPAIGSLKHSRFPYKILENIEKLPNLIKSINDNQSVIIEQYKQGWFSKKKILEVLLIKINDADDHTKSFDSDSDGRIFGIVVKEQGKETYRAIFDLGVLVRFNKGMKELYMEKATEYLGSGSLVMANSMTNQLNVNERLTETTSLLEKLFQ